MRCDTAAHYALLTNARYCHLGWVNRDAVAQVTRHFQKKFDTTEYLMVLPRDAARAILREHAPRIAQAQRSSGGWKIKDTHRISLGYLRAFQYTGLLPEFLAKLTHDPYAPFADRADLHGLVARRILARPGAADGALQQSLRRTLEKAQLLDGSWEKSVLATTLFAQQLLDLGCAQGDAPLRKAAGFLFSQQVSDVDRRSNNHGGGIVAHHMFSSPDRGVEFRVAIKYRPEWVPRALCYRHLPMVQNGMAIRCLNMLGYGEDHRVLAACGNLVEIHDRYGGYCDSLIRNGIIAAERARKARPMRRPVAG